MWNIETLLHVQQDYYLSLFLDMYTYLEKIGGILDLLYHHLPVLITDSWKSF